MARSARRSPRASRPTRSTARTATRTPRSRSTISSSPKKSSADLAATVRARRPPERSGGFFCVWRGNGRLLTTHCGHQTHRSTLMIGGLMSVAWRDIAFQLEPDVAREVAKAWSWLIPEPWEPIVCSTVAGVFLEKPNGEVHWLDTGTGLVEQVASTRAQL